MAVAAKDAGVKHVIWSTFEDTRMSVPLSDARMPTLQGKYKVPHFDAKAEADPYFRDSASRRRSCSPRSTGTTSSTSGWGRRRGPTASWRSPCRWGTGSSRGSRRGTSAGAPTASSGAVPEFIGKTVGVAGEHLTGAQMAAALSSALGQEVAYNAVPPDVFRSFGFPGADDLGNMFQFKADFESLYCGNRDVALSRSLNPGLQTFAQWLSVNKDRIPIG